MRIAIDAMGGDFAPEEIIKGTLEAASSFDGEMVLVGDTEKVKPFLPKHLPANIQLHHASQVVEMHDSPVRMVSKKSDSSLVVAAQMVKDKKADGLFSAGNTGAAVVVCKLLWETIPGIERPAIVSVMPTLNGFTVMLDSGATTDCEPEWLLQFAIMGQAFSKKVLGVEQPKVALINIGEERGKGNALVKKAYDLLHEQLPDFVGNIEGKDIFLNPVDVIVCDGFVGNVVLKTSEGVGKFLDDLLKEEMPKNKLLLAPLKLYSRPMKRFRKRIDYAEYGGAPLLGVNGVCIIGHGRSKAKAVKNALMEVAKAVETRLIDTIAETIKQRADAAATEPSNV